jgi:hypothetical protein
VLVKAGDKAPEEAPAPAAKEVAPAAPAKPILSAEELEKRAAEATRQAELLARQEGQDAGRWDLQHEGCHEHAHEARLHLDVR